MSDVATIEPKAQAIDSSAYLTDGKRLYRIVAPFMDEHPERAVLEDCLTLEVRFYQSYELADMALRPVEPLKEAP